MGTTDMKIPGSAAAASRLYTSTTMSDGNIPPE